MEGKKGGSRAWMGERIKKKASRRLGRLGDKGAGTRGTCWVYASRGSFPIGGAELGREEEGGGKIWDGW